MLKRDKALSLSGEIDYLNTSRKRIIMEFYLPSK